MLTLPKNLTDKARQRVLEDLADFLLDAEPTAARLDAYRRKLGLADPAFALLLGVGVSALRKWRLRGHVPEASAEKAHAQLTGNVVSLFPRTGGWTGFGGSGTSDPQNTPRTPEFEGLAGSLGHTRGLLEAVEHVQRLHRPQPGDAYPACECSVCRVSRDHGTPTEALEARPTSRADIITLHRTVSRWCSCDVCSADRSQHGVA